MAYVNREQEKQVKAAIRATRRLIRTTDSKGEILERVFDRYSKRKTAPTREQLESVIKPFQDYKNSMGNLEKGLADLLSIAAY